ncbi:MAG: 30S ribosomal protein S6 [Candidatus Staskawiczbacteria bacterium]|jgi:ribosomal protein S6
MKTYELSYIISPEITSEEAQTKAKEIESAVQSREGIILKQFNPVAKTLAFPIGKKASGFFGVLEFKVEPEKLLEVKEIVAKDGKIVRHMVIIKEPIKIKKIRRSKAAVLEAAVTEQKTEVEMNQEEKPSSAKASDVKEKVELKDIEQRLEELLG